MRGTISPRTFSRVPRFSIRRLVTRSAPATLRAMHQAPPRGVPSRLRADSPQSVRAARADGASQEAPAASLLDRLADDTLAALDRAGTRRSLRCFEGPVGPR